MSDEPVGREGAGYGGRNSNSGLPFRPFVLFELRDRLDEGVGRETGAPHEKPKVDCGREIEHGEKSTSMIHLRYYWSRTFSLLGHKHTSLDRQKVSTTIMSQKTIVRLLELGYLTTGRYKFGAVYMYDHSPPPRARHGAASKA